MARTLWSILQYLSSQKCRLGRTFNSIFSNHLPKLLLVLFLCLSLEQRSFLASGSLLFPAVSFIGLISCLGLQEWRFIIYVVPFTCLYLRAQTSHPLPNIYSDHHVNHHCQCPRNNNIHSLVAVELSRRRSYDCVPPKISPLT